MISEYVRTIFFKNWKDFDNYFIIQLPKNLSDWDYLQYLINYEIDIKVS